jgi:hypothetical protein
VNSAAIKPRTLCQGCGKSGPLALFRGDAQPRWCACTLKGERARALLKRGFAGVLPGGPYIAAPGSVAAVIFESRADAEFRERCRLASNAERRARDVALTAKWGRQGKRFRELPRSHPKRAEAEKRYAKCLRALRDLQRKCKHPHRCHFNSDACGVCYKTLEPVAKVS